MLSRASGRTGTPERESLERLAALQASLCLYLSARHVEEVQQVLLKHYPADTLVAVGYRVSWPDQQLELVPLNELAAYSQAKGLERTTLYVVSTALAASGQARSRLYSPDHDHPVQAQTELLIGLEPQLVQWLARAISTVVAHFLHWKGSLVRIQYRPSKSRLKQHSQPSIAGWSA